MRVVQSAGDTGHDGHQFSRRDPVRMVVSEQSRAVDPVDELHRDPQLALEVAAIIDVHDVRVPKAGSHLRFEKEPLAVLLIGGDTRPEDLERVLARQPRMVREVDLAHRARADDPGDGVAGERLPVR